MIFDKDRFVATLEAIRGQRIKDSIYASNVKKALKLEHVDPYDNSLLENHLISLLQNQFKPNADGFCEIEYFCNELEFGKAEGADIKSAEELWDKLITESFDKKIGFTPIDKESYKGISRHHPLADEAGHWPSVNSKIQSDKIEEEARKRLAFREKEKKVSDKMKEIKEFNKSQLLLHGHYYWFMEKGGYWEVGKYSESSDAFFSHTFKVMRKNCFAYKTKPIKRKKDEQA